MCLRKVKESCKKNKKKTKQTTRNEEIVHEVKTTIPKLKNKIKALKD